MYPMPHTLVKRFEVDSLQPGHDIPRYSQPMQLTLAVCPTDMDQAGSQVSLIILIMISSRET